MYDSAASPLVRRLLGGKLEPLLRGAAACACGNAHLQEYAARFCERTIVLPTIVDTEIYRPGPGRKVGEEGAVTIGWIGSPSTYRYVSPLLPLLERLSKTHGVRARIVGAGAAAAADSFAGLDLVEWAEEREVADVQAMDIGVMPLPDEPWARGKSGFKLIQYMACGLPVIASPVGVNSTIVAPGVNGILANSAEEWQSALTMLIEGPQLRRTMGEAGRERAVAEFSLASQAPRLVALFQEVAATAGRERRQRL
jgi:glycosyltransferase involved in cell wall biosynthesis